MACVSNQMRTIVQLTPEQLAAIRALVRVALADAYRSNATPDRSKIDLYSSCMSALTPMDLGKVREPFEH